MSSKKILLPLEVKTILLSNQPMISASLDGSKLGLFIRVIQGYGIGLSEIYSLIKMEEGKLSSIDSATTIVCSVPLIDQYVQWYFVSLLNFLRSLGIAIAIIRNDLNESCLTMPSQDERDKMKSFGISFAQQVAGRFGVKLWRDKIAGHIVLTCPSAQDDQNMLNFALSDLKTIFSRGRYVSGEKLGNESHRLTSVSITELHESLVLRFTDLLFLSLTNEQKFCGIESVLNISKP